MPALAAVAAHEGREDGRVDRVGHERHAAVAHRRRHAAGVDVTRLAMLDQDRANVAFEVLDPPVM